MPRLKRVLEVIEEEWEKVRDKKHNTNYIGKKEAIKVFHAICFDFAVQNFSLEQIDAIIESFRIPNYSITKRLNKHQIKDNVGKFYFILTKVQKKLDLKLGIKQFIKLAVQEDKVKQDKKQQETSMAKMKRAAKNIAMLKENI